MFKNIIIFTLIIFIHEVGHFITAIIFKWDVDKIYIYPYGGCTKFQNSINKPLIQELLVLFMGPFFQIVFYFLIRNTLSNYDLIIFQNYNYAILLFNLLPIFPLDGGKLLNIIFSYFMSYKKSLLVTCYISYLFIIVLVLYKKSLTFYLVIFLLIFKLIDERKKIEYYFNTFLLERYLHKYGFKKRKVIKNINYMMRDKKHIIKYHGKYKTEGTVLREKYNVK